MNNKIILSGCIDQFKTQNELLTNDSETFELFSLTQITKDYELTFETIQDSIVDGGNDGGLDSILIIIDDFVPVSIEDLEDITFNRKTNVKIIITQCKKENSFKESSLDKLITSIPELFDLGKSVSALLTRFNSSVVTKATIARESWRKCTIAGGKLEIAYNYCANAEIIEVNTTFIQKSEQLINISKGIFVGSSINYINYSCYELLKLFQTQRNERLQIIYKETPLSTSYDEHGIGYVGTVKLANYKQFLTDDESKIREDLFESNIRHFQGAVDVNTKIKNSIEDISKEDFWWLNNGITIIASNPSLVGTTLSLDNVQIVNGLQTSYSIFLHHNGEQQDPRSVLVKVIINEDKKTIDHIIASTNSQNPVSPSLLRATDDIQRELELFYYNEGYFYDRRKNYYKNQGKPASRIFSIQATAQIIESLLFNNPHSARSKPTSLIKDDSTYNRIFDQTRNYNVYLNSCLLNKKVIELWTNIEDKPLKSKLTNFKLHLSRVTSSLIIGKANILPNDIKELNIDELNDVKFKEAIDFIAYCIDSFQANNPEANLINMAKTKSFTEFVVTKLNEKFQ
ncbi:AIPR family protein [Chryseobacterium sp.]|uniref:AIPR family protein n=1 Tax=Chryseobacterium sp. TaxID=1871047 RepID=UPI0023F53229|nr:AIPR family protein [Chryseobacterium sp.]